jgi:putative redox protein
MITITHEHGDRMAIRVRGHNLVTDQPISGGGDDAGPTPTELFVASLAACAGFYAERFLRRHGPDAGLSITCDFAMSTDRPSRVASVDLRIDVPGPLREDLREALLRAVDQCTVHNSLRTPPAVHVEIRDSVPALAVTSP